MRTRATKVIALVLAGGAAPLPQLHAALKAGVDLVVAADGGLALAGPLGVTPDLLIGDMDSLDPSDLARYPGLERDTHPARKDKLDLELAIDAAIARGATSLRLVATLGDRLDQSLAALLIASRLAAEGLGVSLHAGRHEVHVVAGGNLVTLASEPGASVSLIAMSAGASVTFTGVEYALEGSPLPYGSGLGVSNVALGASVALSVHSGVVALVRAHEPAGETAS